MPPFRVVVQRAPLAQRHAHQAPPCRLARLADRLRHLARLAVTEADAALLVPNHNQRGKPEALATLHHLGDAVDVHQLVLELAVALLAIAAPVSVWTCHSTILPC